MRTIFFIIFTFLLFVSCGKKAVPEYKASSKQIINKIY